MLRLEQATQSLCKALPSAIQYSEVVHISIFSINVDLNIIIVFAPFTNSLAASVSVYDPIRCCYSQTAMPGQGRSSRADLRGGSTSGNRVYK